LRDRTVEAFAQKTRAVIDRHHDADQRQLTHDETPRSSINACAIPRHWFSKATFARGKEVTGVPV
jgi:hypothetical protein